MRRILVWDRERILAGTGSQGARYYADKDYSPGACRLHARGAPAQELKVDIQDDGVSIFTGNYAVLNKGGNLEENAEDYPTPHPFIAEGSVITFHVINLGGADGITCELELDSIDEDEPQD